MRKEKEVKKKRAELLKYIEDREERGLSTHKLKFSLQVLNWVLELPTESLVADLK